MKAVAFTKHGDASVLELSELATPEVGARDVLVRVKAVALNHLDVWVRRGYRGLKVPFPHILGSDIAGVVEQVGPEVSDLGCKAEVVVIPGLSCGSCEDCLGGEDHLCKTHKIIGEHVHGGYAEFIAVPRSNVAAKPARLSFEEAACMPLTFLTAWTMLVRRAQLAGGETLLVHAAGSGVGSAAVQIGKLLGARVIATAGSDAKLDKARALGADHLINYRQEDFLAAVKRFTSRQMVDVVFEHVGGSTFEHSLDCLRRGGRLVTCGATSGHEARIDLRVLFHRRISLLGSTLGSKGDLFRILDLVERGHLRPVLDRTLPLSRAADAHRLLEDRALFGNVVLIP